MTTEAGWQLRTEQESDAEGIDRMLRRAFQGGNAADLVRRLRAEGGYEPGLSWVAVDGEERVLGHVLFSPVAIVRGQVPAPALALAPLGVAPAHQRQGIGSALVRAGIAASIEAGYGIVLVLGDPGYYSRFGFRPVADTRIDAPRPEWDEALQVLEIRPDALDGVRGVARYPAAFDEV
ncbi:MAG: N-acetyltransferase [Planctomycetota bacterium]|nr:N-acetyltransferase [Planctomycetota bacterium]